MNVDELENKIEVAIKIYQQQVSKNFLIHQHIQFENEPVPFRFRDSKEHLFYIKCLEYNERSVLMEINYVAINKKRFFKSDIIFKMMNNSPELSLDEWQEISNPNIF